MKTFIIDIDRCIGCRSCQLVCKDEHCDNDWMPYAAPQPDTCLLYTSFDAASGSSENGISAVQRLLQQCAGVQVIYVTGHVEYLSLIHI